MTEGAANAPVIQSMYAATASDYEEIWAPLLRPYGLRLLDALPLADARTVLDLGCGVGRLLPDVAGRASGALVIGADLTEGMLRCADDRFARVLMDGTRLGFADGSFDAVVSAFVFFHFPDPIAAMTGVRRVLRPGGAFALAVWGTGEVFPAMEAWDEELDAMDVPPDPAEDGPGDGREIVDSPEKVRAGLLAAGFAEALSESAEWLRRWDLDAFLEWRLRLSPSRRRLARLDPGRREAVVAAARERVASMGPEALLHRDEVVLASARAPA
ncbi:MAG: class I SAM-dependent methyltransferase [Actinobacteria bacterium]|nr:class I SAM-dependent methyltransferase [Actinomycetota bacterium]